MKKFDLADENGNIKDIDEAKIKERFPLTDFQKSFIADVNKNCTDFIGQPNKYIDNMESKCNGNTFKYSVCMKMHMFAACPAEKRSSHPRCVKMEKFMGKILNGEAKSDEEQPEGGD